MPRPNIDPQEILARRQYLTPKEVTDLYNPGTSKPDEQMTHVERLEEFKYWLNFHRQADVSSLFHTLVALYDKALQCPPN